MGFRSPNQTTTDAERSSSTPSIQELTRESDQGGGAGSLTPQACEDQFGLEVYRDGMDVQIQRLVDSQGPRQVKQWADEGMSVDTMGKPQDMRAFRERQQERPAEVPTDIERRNDKSVQRSKGAHHEASKAGDSQVPGSVRDVISSSGQSLDTSIQRAMEDRMDDNFGDVRVHTGPKAAKACQDINAKAFTAGNHIAFNQGEYDPSSAEGQHLLAHELAHVRQQSGAAVSMMPQADANLQIDPDPRLEREAEEAAQQAMQDGPVTINRMGMDVHIQRIPEGKVFEAMALFDSELNGEDSNDHRDKHNELQLGYIHNVAEDVIEKQDTQSDLDTKQDLLQDSNHIADDLANRYDSVVDLKGRVEELQNSIDSDLEDVALTEDQQRKLYGGGESDKWDDVSWTVTKTILTAVGIPQLLEAVKMAKEVGSAAIAGGTATADAGTQAAGVDMNERAKQTMNEVRSQAKEGSIPSREDLKDIWTQTNGTLEERAEQIEAEIREGVWLEENHDPYPGGSD